GGRHLGVDLAGLRAKATREAAPAQQVEHAVVVRLDHRLEHLDAAARGGVRELGEYQQPKAPTLELVGDGDAHLGATSPGDDVHRVGDDQVARARHQA